MKNTAKIFTKKTKNILCWRAKNQPKKKTQNNLKITARTRARPESNSGADGVLFDFVILRQNLSLVGVNHARA